MAKIEILTRKGTGTMKKLKIFLTLLSVVIIVVPVAFEVLLYRDNLLGLIVPPEMINLFNALSRNGDGGNLLNSSDNGGSLISDNSDISSLLSSGFEFPQLVGLPQYNPDTNTLSLTFNFTNPLETSIAVDKLEAGIVSHDGGVFLGNVSLAKPLRLEPGQTIDITVLDALSPEAINYFKTNVIGQNSINVDFVNLNVDVAGITVQVDRQNIGNIPIPPQLLR
jgi:hypothetical protein